MANLSKKSDRKKSKVDSGIRDLLEQNTSIGDWSEVPQTKPLTSFTKKTIKEGEEKVRSVPKAASAPSSNRGYSPGARNPDFIYPSADQKQRMDFMELTKNLNKPFYLAVFGVDFKATVEDIYYYFGGNNHISNIHMYENTYGENSSSFSGDCFIEVNTRESLFMTLKKHGQPFFKHSIEVYMPNVETGECRSVEQCMKKGYSPLSSLHRKDRNSQLPRLASSDARKNPQETFPSIYRTLPGVRGPQHQFSKQYPRTYVNHSGDRNKYGNLSSNAKQHSGA